MRFLPTWLHGIVDYAYAALLFALPRFVAVTPQTATFLYVLGVGTVLYAVVTRYELGLLRLLPMRWHLVVDALLGVVFLAYAFAFSPDGDAARGILAGLGVFALAASLLTRSRSSVEARDDGAGGPVAGRPAPSAR